MGRTSTNLHVSCLMVTLCAFFLGSVTQATPIQWPVRLGTNWLICPALTRILPDNLNFLAWSTCVAKCGTNDPKWQWKAGMNQQGNISLENNSDRYNIEQAQFLKISDVTDGDNGTLYKCTVSYFNNRNRTSLAQESDHFHLLFKQKEGTHLKCENTTNHANVDETGNNNPTDHRREDNTGTHPKCENTTDHGNVDDTGDSGNGGTHWKVVAIVFIILCCVLFLLVGIAGCILYCRKRNQAPCEVDDSGGTCLENASTVGDTKTHS